MPKGLVRAESWVSQYTAPTVSPRSGEISDTKSSPERCVDVPELDTPVTYFSEVPNTHISL